MNIKCINGDCKKDATTEFTFNMHGDMNIATFCEKHSKDFRKYSGVSYTEKPIRCSSSPAGDLGFWELLIGIWVWAFVMAAGLTILKPGNLVYVFLTVICIIMLAASIALRSEAKK